MTTACVRKAFSIKERYRLLPRLLRSAVAMLRPLPIKKGTGGHPKTPGRGAAPPSALPARPYFTPATVNGPRWNLATACGVVRDDSRSLPSRINRAHSHVLKLSLILRLSKEERGGEARKSQRQQAFGLAQRSAIKSRGVVTALPRGARGQVGGWRFASVCSETHS